MMDTSKKNIERMCRKEASRYYNKKLFDYWIGKLDSRVREVVMKQEELLKHIDKIGMMSREQVDEFAATVHNSVGLNREYKETLLSEIDDRIAKLNNSFALEVEMSEVSDFDMY